MAPVLEVEGLVKRFPAPGGGRSWIQAVSDVSFELKKGETLGLVGESGSGKTTVGRCLLRLVDPTSGRILFQGGDIARMSARRFRPLRAKIQMVFQEPHESLDPRMTIADAIGEPLRLMNHMSRAQQIKRIVEAARVVYLQDKELAKYPHELSGGQVQRAGIARAMATEPEVIVLDEPTSLLDASVRADITELLVDLQRKTDVTYLFISHDLTTVEHISHRVAVMYLGKVVEIGSTKQIFETPRHPYSRSLLSSVLIPDPTREHTPAPLVGEIPSPINLPTGCSLHKRCPIAIDACSGVTPQLVDVGNRHFVSCIRVAPLPSQIVQSRQLVAWKGPRGFARVEEDSAIGLSGQIDVLSSPTSQSKDGDLG